MSLSELYSKKYEEAIEKTSEEEVKVTEEMNKLAYDMEEVGRNMARNEILDLINQELNKEE